MAFLQPCDALQLCKRILQVSAVYSLITPTVHDNYVIVSDTTIFMYSVNTRVNVCLIIQLDAATGVLNRFMS